MTEATGQSRSSRGRIGALPAALGCGVLGIGAAVAIAFAADASASTGDRSSEAAGVSASSSGARADGAGRSAVNRGPAGTAARSAARPAVTARADAVVPDTPAPAAAPASPRAAAVLAGAVHRGAVPVPETAAAVPPAVATRAAATRAIFPWNDPRGRLITIYKGTHFAIPNSFGFFIREVEGTGTFTANTTYDLKDEDQFDWNKFTGIAFTPLEPDRDSAMVGWRYNLVSGEFEIAPFYNVNKARILPNEQTEVISVPADATFQYRVDYTGITLTYGGITKFKAYPQGLTPNVWTAARVSGWFGGNEVAPRTVSYYLKIN